MSEPVAGLIEDLHQHPCRACDGLVEPVLTAVYPASDVCLDCMAEDDRRRLEQDLNQVQRLDRALLPELPTVAGWEIGLHYRPSRLLSGDFYDVGYEAPPERISLVVGDIMGKGIPAALLRSGLQATLKALGAEVGSPATVLEKANRHFIELASTAKLASVFLGTLDVSTGELCYANAGHLPPLLKRAGGDWRTLDPTGMVLGAIENVPYEEKTIPMSSGDLLVLYSDGITEADNGKGDYFDERNLTATIDAVGGAPVQAIASMLADELSRFAPGDPSDDRTLVLVRRE